MQTVPYLEQIKICQKAIDEFTVLNVESPSWYKYLKLAQERMKILLIQKYMQQPQSWGGIWIYASALNTAGIHPLVNSESWACDCNKERKTRKK